MFIQMDGVSSDEIAILKVSQADQKIPD